MQAEEAKRLTQLEKGPTPAQQASGRIRAGEGNAQGAGRGKLLSPGRRRRAVVALLVLSRVSDCFACRVVGQHPSTQRHGGQVVDPQEANLRRRLRTIAAEHIPWGSRMAYCLLSQDGWLVNHNRVHRVWRE